MGTYYLLIGPTHILTPVCLYVPTRTTWYIFCVYLFLLGRMKSKWTLMWVVSVHHNSSWLTDVNYWVFGAYLRTYLYHKYLTRHIILYDVISLAWLVVCTEGQDLYWEGNIVLMCGCPYLGQSAAWCRRQAGDEGFVLTPCSRGKLRKALIELGLCELAALHNCSNRDSWLARGRKVSCRTT